MSTLRTLQTSEKISDNHLLQVRYVLTRFWELSTTEQVIIKNIVDSGIVGSLEDDLLTIFKRLRKVKWEVLQ